MTITAHPLAWPEGWPRSRSHERKHGQFATGQAVTKKRITIEAAMRRVRYELERLGVDSVKDDSIVSTNLRLNIAGLPRGDQGEPLDTGVAVYWHQKNKPMRVMAIDTYYRVADNLAAIAATLEAMRAIERHGGAVILDRAFTGFAAIAPPQSPWQVLGLAPGASVAEINRAFRAKAATAHPDAGGSTAAMAEINAAREAALREISQRGG